jgi:two-component system, sensor histidine kinase
VDALKLVESLGHGDILVADYHLDSSRTGLEVLSNVRAQEGYDVPGVILSGDLPSLVRTISSPIPAARFLSKPVDTEALLQAIRELSATALAEPSIARAGTRV